MSPSQRGRPASTTLRKALTLDYVVAAHGDDTLPNHVRSAVDNAVRVPFGFNQDAGAHQVETYMQAHDFIRLHMTRMLDHVEKGYPGSTADIRRGQLDWARAA